MKPDGVGSGQLLVYSKLWPGARTGCSPTTPGPRTSCRRPRLRVKTTAWLTPACRGEQRQHLVVGPARAVRADRLDADMVGAGFPMLGDAFSDRRLVAPGDIGVDKALGAAAGEVIIAKA